MRSAPLTGTATTATKLFISRYISDATRAPHGDKLGFYPPCTAIPPDVELRCPTSGGILWYVGGLSRAEWQRVTYAANLSVPIYKGMDAQN